MSSCHHQSTHLVFSPHDFARSRLTSLGPIMHRDSAAGHGAAAGSAGIAAEVSRPPGEHEALSQALLHASQAADSAAAMDDVMAAGSTGRQAVQQPSNAGLVQAAQLLGWAAANAAVAQQLAICALAVRPVRIES